MAGQNNRKYGRWSRAPSMKAYIAAGRLEINRKKRAEKERKKREKKHLKLAQIGV